jgi:hypothetical protein
MAHFHTTLPNALPHLCDTLFRESAFPEAWKLAHCLVIPKLGKGSYTIPKCYQPIWLRPYLSKVFEEIVANYTTQAVLDRLAISSTQMGIGRHYSAIDALLKILSPICADLSKKKTTGQQPYYPSLLAHNIEGTLNNTNPILLTQVIQQCSMPSYLCNWI